MSQEQKRESFEVEHRVIAVLDMLAEALVKEGHIWTNEERKAYDLAVRSLKSNCEALAA